MPAEHAPRLAPLGQTAAAHISLAKALFARGRFRQAVEQIDRALADNPELAEGHFIKGLVLARAGDGWAAGRSLDRALELDPGLVGACLARAQLHFDRGELEEVLVITEKALGFGEKLDRLHLLRGETFAALKRRDEAVHSYRESIRHNPNAVVPRYKLGVLLVEMGRDDEAFEQVLTAKRLSPSNVNNRLALGGLLAARQRYDEALREYRAAAELASVQPLPYVKSAELYVERGMKTEAANLFKIALKLDEKNVSAYLGLGRIYLEEGWTAEAREMSRAALELDPRLPEAIDLARDVEAAAS